MQLFISTVPATAYYFHLARTGLSNAIGSSGIKYLYSDPSK